MSYTQPALIRTVLGPADDPSTAAVLGDAELATAAEEAQTEVDATLAVRYAVPFDEGERPIPVPPLVANITRDIAAFLATLQLMKGAPIAPTHPVLLRWQRATKQLAGIANGSIDLALQNDDPVDEPTEEDAGATVVNAGDVPDDPVTGRMFTRDELGIDRSGRVGWRWLGENVPY